MYTNGSSLLAEDEIFGSQETYAPVYATIWEIQQVGQKQWIRIRETIEFCRRMDYKKIGVAFCRNLREEARILVRILRRHGFHVTAVMCKADGLFQAALLNEQRTDFNLAVGMCVSRDTVFYKYSKAMVTTVITR